MLTYTTETPETAQEACLWCDRSGEDVQYIQYTTASGKPSVGFEPMCDKCQRIYKEGAYKHLRK